MKKNNSKKKIIIVFAVLVLLLLALYAISAILSKTLESVESKDYSQNPNEVSQNEPIRTTFYPADYDEDIMQDPYYLSQNRYIEYASGGVSVLITDGDFASFGEGALFFQSYFDTVINGRYEEYPSYFTKEYLDAKNGYDTAAYEDERFTMQKIFDIKVELLDETETEDEQGKLVERVFVVRYKILENNGTFRKDIGDDATYIPLVFETVSRNGETKINKVYTYYV